MSDIVTKVDCANKDGVLLRTEKRYCNHNILVLPKLNALEIRENGTYPVPHGFAGNGQVKVNVASKKETALVVTENGTYLAPPGTVYTSIVVNVPTTSSGGTPEGGEGEAPHVHKYTSEVFEPSCLQGGYTLHTCECGETYKSDETAPRGHNYINGTCSRCGAVDPSYKPDASDPSKGSFSVIVGDTFRLSYEGSSPDVECPYCVTCYVDSDELIFTAVSAGSGVIYIRRSETLIGEYTVTVTAVERYDYNLKIDDIFEFNYHGSPPSVSCPSFLTYYDDGGVLVFTAAEEGFGTLSLYDNGTLIAVFTVTVTAHPSGSDTHVHNFVSVITKPTCDTEGYTTHTCKTCNYSYRDTPTDALGHVWGDPFEWGNGFARECKTCGAIVPILDGACDHMLENPETVKPTCTTGGYTTYTCSICGQKIKLEPTDPLGHKYQSTVTNPTCTTEGYTTHVCSGCGHSYTSGKTDAFGHAEDEPVLVNADKMSCEVCAKYEVRCKHCGTFLYEYTDDGFFGDHVFTIPDRTEPPTCTEAGYDKNFCDVCGSWIVVKIGDPAYGHDFQLVKDDSQSSGASMKCTRCDLVDGEANYDCDILGHDYMAVEDASQSSGYYGRCVHCGFVVEDYSP